VQHGRMKEHNVARIAASCTSDGVSTHEASGACAPAGDSDR
jgi:hypothetical protein